MAASKRQFETVDEYIQTFPEDVRSVLETLRQTIKEEIPEAEETISYNMPTYKLNGSYVVYFAGWKKHVSMYPFSSEMEASMEEASTYKTSGKGTIQFPINQPLPLPFIRKIVAFLVNKNRART